MDTTTEPTCNVCALPLAEGYDAETCRTCIFAEHEPDQLAVRVAMGEALRNGSGVLVYAGTGSRLYPHVARIIRQGDPYGLRATWKDERPGLTISDTPGTYYAETIASNPGRGPLLLDAGQGWALTPESTEAVERLALEAVG